MKLLIFFISIFSSISALSQSHNLYGDSKSVKIIVGNLVNEKKTETENIYKSDSENTLIELGISKRTGFTADSQPFKINIKFKEQEDAISSIEDMATTPQAASETEPLTDENVVEASAVSITTNYYAIIIGVSDYQYATAGLSNLDQPLIDANRLKKVLLDQYKFNVEQTFLVANPTRSDILNTLELVAKKVGSSDNLLIFYAGHGYWDEFLKIGYWLPSDAKMDDKTSWVSNSTIRDYISAIPSKHTLLITDACFGGSIFKTRSAEKLNAYAVSKIYKLPSRKAMTSGTLTKVPDQSVFIKYLVKRLYENQEDFLSASQLFYSMQNAILNNSSVVPQLGVIQDTGDEGGDFVFLKK
jgi:hypothetical protein